ncbi:mid1-interacting protein 1A-like [Centruroides sculpturatus]|uniref:mid1-interacting protein 1A-like n=1 Tax=Centruroides sculpturatus TaxID=218467 RepID=UPI000C6E8C8B|nr:mid1-interacting protein 1A-like [Centruroides sculpturatus]
MLEKPSLLYQLGIMAERSRRVSYAGLSLPTQQPSRRLSYAGPSGSRLTIQEVCGVLDNNDRSRRPSKHSEESFACSQQSVLSAMDRFVVAVNNMDATVLVPSRLRDMDITKPLPSSINNPDLFSFYNMLKDVKNELLWGPVSPELPKQQQQQRIPAASGSRHIRQPSDGSLGSTGSYSDQETDSDMDSLMTESSAEQTFKLSSAFRHHMQGLHSILHELANSANYLASLYQEEVDATSP